MTIMSDMQKAFALAIEAIKNQDFSPRAVKSTVVFLEHKLTIFLIQIARIVNRFWTLSFYRCRRVVSTAVLRHCQLHHYRNALGLTATGAVVGQSHLWGHPSARTSCQGASAPAPPPSQSLKCMQSMCIRFVITY